LGVVIESEEAKTDEEQNVESNIAESIYIALRASHRNSHIPSKFKGFEMTFDANIDEDGDVIHFALFSKIELVTFEEAISNNK